MILMEKLLKLAVNGHPQLYRNLLKKYNLSLGEDHYGEVERYVKEFEAFFPKEEDGSEPARGMVFTHIAAALEEVFSSYGVQQYQDIRLTSLRFKRLGDEPKMKFAELIKKAFDELGSILDRLKGGSTEPEVEEEVSVDVEDEELMQEDVLPQPTKIESVESIIDANENGKDADDTPAVKRGPGRPKKDKPPKVKGKPGRPKKQK